MLHTELRDRERALQETRVTTLQGTVIHVPSHLLTMSGRDSCLQPDARNLFGTTGNVVEYPPAPDEPTASCSGNVYARSLSATHCEPVSLNRRRSVAKIDELERNKHSKPCNTYTEICQEVSRRKQCFGSKKWRWSTRWTIFSLRSQLEGIDSGTLRCFMRRLPLP